MKLAKYIANLGYGTRKEMELLVARGRVTRADGGVVREGDAFAHEELRLNGRPLDPPPGALIMLHKPVGYVCSTADENPLIYALLPPRFALRSPKISPVGRLDMDSSGLLLLTDDGKLNHRIASPRRHLLKVYEAALAEDLRGDEAEIFASGALTLAGESTPLLPAALEIIDPRRVRVTLTEGRYHQVRRMFAAVGNHVTSLHRAAVGGLWLGDLPAGGWRLLSEEEVALVSA